MSNILTREQYLEIMRSNIAAYPLPTRVYFSREEGIIDQDYFLECDDDWGLPLPYGWIAADAHFTGTEDQDYSTLHIIEVKYD